MSERSGGHCVEFGYKIGFNISNQYLRSLNNLIKYEYNKWIKSFPGWGPFAVFNHYIWVLKYVKDIDIGICPCLYIKSDYDMLWKPIVDGVMDTHISFCPEGTELADEIFLFPDVNMSFTPTKFEMVRIGELIKTLKSTREQFGSIRITSKYRN